MKYTHLHRWEKSTTFAAEITKTNIIMNELKETIGFELDQLSDRYGDIIDALAEIGYLLFYDRKGKQFTGERLLESLHIISEPLILYKQFLEQVEQAARKMTLTS